MPSSAAPSRTRLSCYHCIRESIHQENKTSSPRRRHGRRHHRTLVALARQTSPLPALESLRHFRPVRATCTPCEQIRKANRFKHVLRLGKRSRNNIAGTASPDISTTSARTTPFKMGFLEPFEEIVAWIRGHLPTSAQLRQLKHFKLPGLNFIMVHCRSTNMHSSYLPL